MNRSLLCAAVAAALVSAGGAHAAATQVNFGFVPIGTFSYVGSSLGTSTSLNFGNATFDVNTIGNTAPFADDSGAVLGMDVFFSSPVFNYTIGSTTAIDLAKTFTTDVGGADGSAGLYTAVFSSITADSAGANFLNMRLVGTVTGPNGFSAADVLLLNCNQSGGGGLSVNCSFTEQGPPLPSQVPEPATLGLVGLALLGMSRLRRRTS